jgi:hypothetical protein
MNISPNDLRVKERQLIFRRITWNPSKKIIVNIAAGRKKRRRTLL